MSNSDASRGIIVLTAPSGAGKTTIAGRLLAAPLGLRFSVSATTRPMREGETDGINYHFLSETAFKDRIAAGALLEYEEVYPGRFYGTLVSEVEAATAHQPVLLDIDVMGARRVKELFGERALVIFIRPPSEGALERRLKGRGTETSHDLAVRLKRSREELAFADTFDLCVINDDLDAAVEETIAAVRSFLDPGRASGSKAHEDNSR